MSAAGGSVHQVKGGKSGGGGRPVSLTHGSGKSHAGISHVSSAGNGGGNAHGFVSNGSHGSVTSAAYSSRYGSSSQAKREKY